MLQRYREGGFYEECDIAAIPNSTSDNIQLLQNTLQERTASEVF
jgi:hypothetical protein